MLPFTLRYIFENQKKDKMTEKLAKNYKIIV